ncbi:phage tail protein [Metapseudomonas otitidis]|uniref:phage tail protein n=1 Tax=Metapseudomonas otitidis TaxID=319939 RepID=UPI001CA439EB|nr:phage tail protein [Pseudomonas otitidis]QZX85352.1 phage tail protein [Pseudomonas otitidis]
MAKFPLPNGAVLEIATGFDAKIAFTAITNAKPPVLTAAAHGLQNGEVVLIESGWARLSDRATVVSNVTTDSLSLLGVDTRNAQQFTAGAGVGSLLPVSGWTQISKVTTFSVTGGDQNFLTVGYLEDDDDKQAPTNRNPISLSVTVEDQPAAAYVEVVEDYSETKEIALLRLKLRSGGQIIYPGYASITSTPSMERNNLMTRVITLGLSGQPIRITA